MKQLKILIYISLLCLILTGCGKQKEETSEEITTEIVTEITESSEEWETIGHGEMTQTDATSGELDLGTNSNAVEELPETMEPLDNDDIFNPTISGLDLMNPSDFHRGKLLSAILDYMYKAGIKDDVCTKIHVDENFSQNTVAYKMTLSFEKHEDEEVSVIWYNNTYYDIQKYINDEDIGFEEDYEP